jgi:hypothetical protein
VFVQTKNVVLPIVSWDDNSMTSSISPTCHSLGLSLESLQGYSIVCMGKSAEMLEGNQRAVRA